MATPAKFTMKAAWRKGVELAMEFSDHHMGALSAKKSSMK
jgi:hypothetical protein